MSIKQSHEKAYTEPDLLTLEFKCKSVLLSSFNSDSEIEELDDITTTLNWES